VAAALLVPLPIFAATGLSAPLPNAIEHALGGLVLIDAQDEHTGSSETVAASEEGTGAKRTANVSLAVTRRRARRTQRSLPPAAVADLLNPPTKENGTGGDASTQREDSPAQDGGGSGSPEQPAGPGAPRPADRTATDKRSAVRTAPSAHIGVAGPGAGVGLSVGPSGVVVDAGADTEGGAGPHGVGDGEVTVTHPDGSSTGAGVTVPGPGVRIP
jgi:hypothetical protein